MPKLDELNLDELKKNLKTHTYSRLRNRYGNGDMDSSKVPVDMLRKEFEKFIKSRPDYNGMQDRVSKTDLEKFIREVFIKEHFDEAFRFEQKRLWQDLQQLRKHKDNLKKLKNA